MQSLEGVQVDGDHSGVVFAQQGLDRGGERRFFGSARELFDGSVFIVGDPQAVQEVAQHPGLRPDQPDLEQMGGDAFVGRAGKGILEPGKALDARFAFDKHRAQVAFLGQGVEGRLVERLLFFKQEAEDLRRNGGRHLGENFVWGHEVRFL